MRALARRLACERGDALIEGLLALGLVLLTVAFAVQAIAYAHAAVGYANDDWGPLVAAYLYVYRPKAKDFEDLIPSTAKTYRQLAVEEISSLIADAEKAVFDLCTTGPWSRALFTLPPDQRGLDAFNLLTVIVGIVALSVVLTTDPRTLTGLVDLICILELTDDRQQPAP